MNCPYCGQDNPESNETCDFCGGSLYEPVDTQEGEFQQPEAAPDDLSSTLNQSPAPEGISPPVAGARRGISGNKIWWFIGCFVLIILIVGCAAAGWGIYRFLFAPSARNTGPLIQLSDISETPIPVPSGENLLLFDDFSNPNSGWNTVEEADYSTNYYNNAYRITVNTNMYDSWAYPNSQTYADAILEVDATKNGGPDDNDFGLICRYQDNEHFYYAVISSDGYFGIIKVNGDSSGLLGREYLEYSDSIPQGYATSHLRFECLGDKLTFYVNGQLIDQQSDGEYAEGEVGLIAGTYDNPGTDILFDNFSIYAP